MINQFEPKSQEGHLGEHLASPMFLLVGEGLAVWLVACTGTGVSLDRS